MNRLTCGEVAIAMHKTRADIIHIWILGIFLLIYIPSCSPKPQGVITPALDRVEAVALAERTGAIPVNEQECYMWWPYDWLIKHPGCLPESDFHAIQLWDDTVEPWYWRTVSSWHTPKYAGKGPWWGHMGGIWVAELSAELWLITSYEDLYEWCQQRSALDSLYTAPRHAVHRIYNPDRSKTR